MTRFELYSSQCDFLIKLVKDSLVKKKLAGAEPSGGRSGRLVVFLSDDDREKILDDLDAAFCEIGLRPDSEPNQVGIYIESFIDTFDLYK